MMPLFFLLLIAFCGGLKGTIFHLIIYALLYDSWRHPNLLQNGYEIFLVMRSGRECMEKDFLMTVKNNEKKLLGEKKPQHFSRTFWHQFTWILLSLLSVSGSQQCWGICYVFHVSGGHGIVSVLAHQKDFLVLGLLLPCNKMELYISTAKTLGSVLTSRVFGA